MKKKIIIALISVSVVFLLGGIYIIYSIQSATSDLDRLIILHQVEILREHLLLKIRQVQSDLNLKDTRHARNPEQLITNVQTLEAMSSTCYDCHHSEGVKARLDNLNREIQDYKVSLSRALTMRAHRDRVTIESDTAFQISERLLNEVDKMVHIASNKLYSHTTAKLNDITRTKIILYILVILTPFVAAGFGYIIIREITKPIKSILHATRKLKNGDLEYRIEGLKDEYAEVATSFNEMSTGLKQSMRQVKESEKRYRMLFESAGDAIFILEAEGENAGKIIAANPAAAEMHGYSLDEMLKLNIVTDLDGPDAAVQAPDRIKRMHAGEWISAENTHRRKDGTVFPVEISAGLFEVDGHKYILAFDRDISERKKMENLILQSKYDWEDTFNTIP
ncbi:MAG: PAS domain S-box protein, partial [Desulfobacterales bacterium]|nr:PAS domain S-box protein [Desulfobacterales bacterium]